MKKLLLILFIAVTVTACKKSDSDAVKKDVTYTIKVTPENKYASYSFYEPNVKLIERTNDYTTVQTYKEGDYIMISCIFTTDQKAKIEVFNANGLIESKEGTKDIRLSFTAY